jgi:hypothetical protein
MSQQIIACPGCGKELEISSTAWSGKGKCQFCGCKFRLRYDPEVLVHSKDGPLPNLITLPTYVPDPTNCPDCHKSLEIPFETWGGKVKCQFCGCKFRVKCKPEVLTPGTSSDSPPPPAPAPVPVAVVPAQPKIQVFRKPAPGIKPAGEAKPEVATISEAGDQKTPSSASPGTGPVHKSAQLSTPATPIVPAPPGVVMTLKTAGLQKPVAASESASVESLKERVMKIKQRVAGTPPAASGGSPADPGLKTGSQKVIPVSAPTPPAPSSTSGQAPIHLPTPAPSSTSGQAPIHLPTPAPSSTSGQAPIHLPTPAPVPPPKPAAAPIPAPVPAPKTAGLPVPPVPALASVPKTAGLPTPAPAPTPTKTAGLPAPASIPASPPAPTPVPAPKTAGLPSPDSTITSKDTEPAAPEPEAIPKKPISSSLPKPDRVKFSLKKGAESKSIEPASPPAAVPESPPPEPEILNFLSHQEEPASSPGWKKWLVWGCLLLLLIGIGIGVWHFMHGKGKIAKPSQPTITKIIPKVPAIFVNTNFPVTATDVETKGQGLREKLLATFGGEATRDSIVKALESKEMQANLARAEVFHLAGMPFLKELAARPQGAEFLSDLFSNPEWLNEVLVSGPTGNLARSLHYLHLIRQREADAWREPLYRRLATAIALEAGGSEPNDQEPNDPLALRTFQVYKEHHQKGLLHASFDTLPMHALRYAVLVTSETNLRSLIKERNARINDYSGTGVTPDNKSAGSNTQSEGGNALASFGAMSARVHGIAAMSIGRPEAYAVRDPNGLWQAGSDNDALSGSGCFWGGSFPSFGLMEEAFSQPEKTIRAHQCAWIAHLFQDKVAEGCRIGPEFTYQAYLGSWNGIPDFSQLTPVKNGTSQGITLAGILSGTGAVVFEGRMKADLACKLHLRMRSKEGARLLIDGIQALQTRHSEETAIIPIETGEHKIRLEVQQSAGDKGLNTWFTVMPNRALPQVETAYMMAMEACPLQYGLCMEAGDWGKREKATDAGFWERYANIVTGAYAGYHEMGWKLLAQYPGAGLNEFCTPDQMATWLLDCHKKMAEGRFNPKWGGVLSPAVVDPVLACQWKLVKQDETAGLRLFEGLLKLHANDTTPYLSSTLEWGNAIFGKNPAVAGKFHGLMRTSLEACSDKTDKERLRHRLIAMVRDAAARDDLAGYQRLHELIATIYKPNPTAETGLDQQQLAIRPKFTAPNGTLLSNHALIKASSYADSDRPLSHPNILGDNNVGGLISTIPEPAPWIVVVLPGTCEISNLLLINAWESEATQATAVPLSISVSEDGQKWIPAGKAITEPWSFWKIPFKTPFPKGRYVKFERQPGAKKEPFQFRQILIYGKALY